MRCFYLLEVKIFFTLTEMKSLATSSEIADEISMFLLTRSSCLLCFLHQKPPQPAISALDNHQKWRAIPGKQWEQSPRPTGCGVNLASEAPVILRKIPKVSILQWAAELPMPIQKVPQLITIVWPWAENKMGQCYLPSPTNGSMLRPQTSTGQRIDFNLQVEEKLHQKRSHRAEWTFQERRVDRVF